MRWNIYSFNVSLCPHLGYWAACFVGQSHGCFKDLGGSWCRWHWAAFYLSSDREVSWEWRPSDLMDILLYNLYITKLNPSWMSISNCNLVVSTPEMLSAIRGKCTELRDPLRWVFLSPMSPAHLLICPVLLDTTTLLSYLNCVSLGVHLMAAKLDWEVFFSPVYSDLSDQMISWQLRWWW